LRKTNFFCEGLVPQIDAKNTAAMIALGNIYPDVYLQSALRPFNAAEDASADERLQVGLIC